MIRSILLAALTLGLSPLTLAESNIDCRAIAAATVAELRAGHEAWSDAAEQLARSAAGAACVKATMSSPTVNRSEGLSSTVVTADGIRQTDIANAPAPVAGSAEVSAVDSSAGAEAAKTGEGDTSDADSSWNPFSDIKFNKVSARPNKKPYERRRQSVDEE